MKNKNGFTLIELLAVIIILGILMIIAIPSVTRYISDSRKNAYVDTAKEIISGARNLVNEGKLEMYDTNTTYYIPTSCIKTENASKSPYGEFIKDKTYVVVTYDGKGYSYYWVSLDDAGEGVSELKSIDELDTDDIKSDLTRDDIKDNIGVGNREIVTIFNETCTAKINKDAYRDVLCKRATTLHFAMCEQTGNDGCSESVGNGNTITYGNNPATRVNGVLQSGDAFDCDVNGDGEFDSSTERFYYVTNYLDDNNKETAVLIYYINSSNSAPYSSPTDIHEVDPNATSSYDNLHGPVTAIKYLKSITTWSNQKLKSNQTRNIVNELGGKTTRSGRIVDSFTYTGYASRLLTYQEVQDACGTNLRSKGVLNNCNYLLENTQFEKPDGKPTSYWLETPTEENQGDIWFIIGKDSMVTFNLSPYYYGVRPAIDVLLSNIGY